MYVNLYLAHKHYSSCYIATRRKVFEDQHESVAAAHTMYVSPRDSPRSAAQNESLSSAPAARQPTGLYGLEDRAGTGAGQNFSLCLSPRASSDSGMEGPMGPRSMAGLRGFNAADVRCSLDGRVWQGRPSTDYNPELRLRIPGDAGSACVSENGDSAMPSASASPMWSQRRSFTQMGAPLVRTGGLGGSMNHTPVVRSVSHGNLAFSSTSESGTPSAYGGSVSTGQLLHCLGTKEAAAEARRSKAAENMRNMERISLQALGDVRGEGMKLPGTPIGARRQARP